MAEYIDLHLHTCRSDGALEPGQLLEIVRRKKLRAFSITDHDTLEGCRAALALLQPGDPELIAGVELSVWAESADLHMLAYLFDPDHADLNEALAGFQKQRNERGRLIVEKLNQQGVSISYAAVEQAARGSAIGRPHIADVLVAQGVVRQFDEAFREYIGNHCPAYVPKSRLLPKAAIDLIHRAGGVAVLAHPYIADMVRFIDMLIPLGLDGFEAYHYSQDRQQRRQLKRLAARHGLIVTGGSDFHGRSDREGQIGSEHVPAELLEPLRLRQLQIRGLQ